MKRIVTGLMALTLAVFCLAGRADASIIFEDDFEDYDLGTLGGQGGWTAVSAALVQVQDGPAGSVNTSQVIGNREGTAQFPRVDHAINFDFGTYPLGLMSFDFNRTGQSGNPYSGIATRATNTQHGLGFVVTSHSTTPLSYRQGVDTGAATALTDIDGVSINISNSTWYRLQAIFDVNDDIVTEVWLEDLTAGGSPIRLYFGANTPTLTMTTAVSDWNQLRIRVPDEGTSNIMYDNVVISAIPEPGSWALLMVAVTGLFAVRRSLHR